MTPEAADLRAAYERDGFVAIEGLVGTGEVAALNAEAVAVARGERGAVLGAAPSSGDHASTHEDVAIADVLALHFPHKLSPVIRAAMRLPAIVEVLTALIGPNVKAMQTMFFVKRAGKPGQAWHQDEHYIPTRDRSLVGVWIALDDATIENGCLWMHPGSHAAGVLWPTRAHGDARFDPSEEAIGQPYAREGGRSVELKAGGVAFFNGYVLHRSLPNTAPAGFRRALVTHYMRAESLLPWETGFPPRPHADFRDVELIAGEDPYAWKGTVDESIPYVRPDDPVRAAAVFARFAEEAGRRG